MEFQICGSPHVTSILWVIKAPVLTKNNIAEYVRFADDVVKAYVPDADTNDNPDNPPIKFIHIHYHIGHIEIQI